MPSHFSCGSSPAQEPPARRAARPRSYDSRPSGHALTLPSSAGYASAAGMRASPTAKGKGEGLRCCAWDPSRPAARRMQNDCGPPVSYKRSWLPAGCRRTRLRISRFWLLEVEPGVARGGYRLPRGCWMTSSSTGSKASRGSGERRAGHRIRRGVPGGMTDLTASPTARSSARTRRQGEGPHMTDTVATGRTALRRPQRAGAQRGGRPRVYPIARPHHRQDARPPVEVQAEVRLTSIRRKAGRHGSPRPSVPIGLKTPARYIMVGGFLGAGKTTAILHGRGAGPYRPPRRAHHERPERRARRYHRAPRTASRSRRSPAASAAASTRSSTRRAAGGRRAPDVFSPSRSAAAPTCAPR